MNIVGLAMGCDIVRVGFEDDLHLLYRTAAWRPITHELVAEMAELVLKMGCEVATAADASKILGAVPHHACPWRRPRLRCTHRGRRRGSPPLRRHGNKFAAAMASPASVAVAELSPELGAQTVQLVRADGGIAELIQTDVTDEASVDAMIGQVVTRFGKLDILYNNAGGSRGHDGPVTEVALDEFWRAIKLDLLGTWLCSPPRHSRNHQGGRRPVINTASERWPARLQAPQRLHRRQGRCHLVDPRDGG